MAFELKPGRICLFANHRTGTNPPAYTGNLTLESGELVRVALWSETATDGSPYLAGTVRLASSKNVAA